jgi:hypothetical protein
VLSSSGLQAQERERVAGIHRQRNARLLVQAGSAPPTFADVLDVVVDQHGVVHQLDGRRVLRAASVSAPNALAVAMRRLGRSMLLERSG